MRSNVHNIESCTPSRMKVRHVRVCRPGDPHGIESHASKVAFDSSGKLAAALTVLCLSSPVRCWRGCTWPLD
jgi:hypothetical protein